MNFSHSFRRYNGRKTIYKMNNIDKAFDSYADFSRDIYYSLVFGSLPSSLELKINLDDNRENMETILSLFDFSLLEMEIIFKNWKTEDYKNTKLSDDFVYEYMFKSKVKNLMVWISLEHKELYIDFLYEGKDSELEEWVIQTNHAIRVGFGEMETPSFKVLTKNDTRFVAEKVNTNNFDIHDIELLYNDDFKKVNEIIVESISENKSGLILLHGKPGTGKTSYIKNLISKFNKKSFIFIQNDFIQELLKPQFVSFLLKNKNCILIIEDAEKVVMQRESSESSVVSTILQLTDGLFSDYLNIKVICTFNTELRNIDKALLRKGRMLARYEFGDLSIEKTNKLLASLGHPEMHKEMSLSSIFKFKDMEFEKESTKKIGFN